MSVLIDICRIISSKILQLQHDDDDVLVVETSLSLATTEVSTLEERLKNAEELIDSYRDKIHSNEHLVDCLYQRLEETTQFAQNLQSSRNELLQGIEILYKKQQLIVVNDDDNDDEDNDDDDDDREQQYLPSRIMFKFAMITILLLYKVGFVSDSCLIITVVIYLMEDIL